MRETPNQVRSSLSAGSSKSSIPPLINDQKALKFVCERLRKEKMYKAVRILLTPEISHLARWWQLDNKYPSLLFYKQFGNDFLMRVR